MPKKLVKYDARFETRMSAEQKAYYQRACDIGGFRSLTDFAIAALQEKAKAIIQEHETFLKTEKDWEIFINAILHPPKPNKYLKDAMKKYKKFLARK